jgi:hypothetical protein
LRRELLLHIEAFPLGAPSTTIACLCTGVRAFPTPVRAPPPPCVLPIPKCAPSPQVYAPPPQNVCASLASVRAPRVSCAPHAGVCVLPRRHVRPSRMHARPPTAVRAPPRRCLHPPPAGVRTLPRVPTPVCAPSQTCAPCSHQRARLRRWWQNKIYKEGSLISPLHHAWLCVLGLLCGLLV